MYLGAEIEKLFRPQSLEGILCLGLFRSHFEFGSLGVVRMSLMEEVGSGNLPFECSSSPCRMLPIRLHSCLQR